MNATELASELAKMEEETSNPVIVQILQEEEQCTDVFYMSRGKVVLQPCWHLAALTLIGDSHVCDALTALLLLKPVPAGVKARYGLSWVRELLLFVRVRELLLVARIALTL